MSHFAANNEDVRDKEDCKDEHLSEKLDVSVGYFCAHTHLECPSMSFKLLNVYMHKQGLGSTFIRN